MTWRLDAACRGMDVNLFYPPRGDYAGVQAAKAVCAGCPVSDECLTEVLVDTVSYDNSGIFGGTLAKDRRRLRRVMGISDGREHRPMQPCGTAAAYKRHLRNGEPACDKCLLAHRLRSIERQARQPRSKAGV